MTVIWTLDEELVSWAWWSIPVIAGLLFVAGIIDVLAVWDDN